MTTRAAFADVDLWVFDLDNTLYPRPDGLWAQVHAKMRGFIIDLLGVDDAKAQEVQVSYYRQYGLTMRGLMMHHGVDPDAFNAHVHDVDLSDIAPNPALGEAIAALPGRRVIHTNSDRGHTGRVLARLGIEGVFDAVYDIADTAYCPKPDAAAYRVILDAENADPSRAAMFEDMAVNLVQPHELGMRTVWTPSGFDGATEGAEDGHVHFVTDDLTGFVRTLAEERAAA